MSSSQYAYFTPTSLQQYCRQHPEDPVLHAVIGNPIAHSKSPGMQNAALQAAGLRGRYVRLLLEPQELPAGLQLCAQLGIHGLNVTVPYKQDVLPLCQTLDSLAQRACAANTLHYREGAWHGYNTDGVGFIRSLQSEYGLGLEGRRVALLGAAGGAGLAIAAALLQEKLQCLYLLNRSEHKLQPLQQWQQHADFALHMLGTQPQQLEQAMQECDIIINATSVGMQQQHSLIAAQLWQPQHVLVDIVTHQTLMQQQAAAASARVIDGKGMLLWQGALAFEIWHALKPDIDAMRQGLLHGQS